LLERALAPNSRLGRAKFKGFLLSLAGIDALPINEIVRFSLIIYTITGRMSRKKAKRKENELAAELTTKVERIRKEEN
jgi:hypothetical protein